VVNYIHVMPLHSQVRYLNGNFNKTLIIFTFYLPNCGVIYHLRQSDCLSPSICCQTVQPPEDSYVLWPKLATTTACECGNEPSGSVKCGEFLD